MDMSNIYEGTLKYKLIYIYSIPDKDHEGYLKIGEHSFDSSSSYLMLLPNCEELNKEAHKRILGDLRTPMVRYDLLYTELARKTVRLADGTVESTSFSDHDVHNVLYRSGYDARKFFETSRDSEWFHVTLKPAIAAIHAVKEGRNVLSAEEKGLAGEQLTLTGAVEPVVRVPQITLREEQQECVEKTRRIFTNRDRMLWDCKMRFGKTITAYAFVKKMAYQKVLVVTHRPVVVAGWKEDHDKIFAGTDHLFVTKSNITAGDRFTSEDASIDAENDRHLRNLVQQGRSFVYFASMQDLRGSKLVDGPYEKNRSVFDMDWDLIIYDEAHEGTQTELGQKVQELLERPKDGKKPKKVLQLSGTPYNLLAQYEDDAVYSWDYVKEQTYKREWNRKHPGDFNPYAALPELRICTFDLRDKLKNSYRYEDENVAFNFREFFRVWTGDPDKDGTKAEFVKAVIGDFVHADDVKAFLDLISADSVSSNYPFSTEEYRQMFKHTFWILPGTKEAAAFSRMLKSHDVFKNYEIVNVAGEGDEERPFEDALRAVRSAIAKNDRTITLSCGRLTTGVTVPEWTGVMLLSGSASAGAAGYMQTIFRVQSAGSIDGKQKEVCYAFDFAPDRALKVLSDVHQLKKSAVGTDDKGRIQLGEFLNFCPVLAEGDSGMVSYDVPKLMRSLKRLTVDAAIKSGFDDDSIYKADAGIVMDNGRAELMEKLRARLDPRAKGKKEREVKITEHGLTDEQYQKAQDAKRKPKKDRTKEELEALEKEKEQKKKQQALFALLRNISIRLPLLIYGTAQDFDESIRLADFIDIVDDASWLEFMPKEVDKDLFRRLLVFYDEDVIEGAGMRIRRLARAADELKPTQRVMRIAEIFSYFRNPAKETVLTPWRVVNMHMGDTVGGYNFYKEGYPVRDGLLEEPRLVDQGDVTDQLFLNEDVKILEMNSKSGLYPLYLAYSIYRILLPKNEIDMTLEETQTVWDEVLRDHLFVLCQTKMAVSITERTLTGYRETDTNTIYLSKLLERMVDQPRLARKITNPETWGKEGERLKFDAIVGNPPYQKIAGGNSERRSVATMAVPLFNSFVEQARAISPDYISMITPARWYTGGIGLNDFRKSMLDDRSIVKLYDFINSRDCFNNVEIAGGLCYFLWDKNNPAEECEIINVSGQNRDKMVRPLSEFNDIFIRSNKAISIIDKVKAVSSHFMIDQVYYTNPFGFRPFARGESEPFENAVKLIHSQGIGYVKREDVVKNADAVDTWKVTIGCLVPCNGEVGIDPEKGYKGITSPRKLGPNEIPTESYLVLGCLKTEKEADNLLKYMLCKFTRYMLRLTYSSMHIAKNNFLLVPIQDWNETWDDERLYKKYHLSEEEIAVIEKTMRQLSEFDRDDD